MNELSVTEREVAALLRRGFTNKQIAEERQVSVGTIKNQVSMILSKKGVSSRCEFVARHPAE